MQDAVARYQVAIIGAGFGGLAMAIRLLQRNIQNFVILEKSNEVGGTWRENQYPGAACDVQSHLYSLSFAPKTDWSKRYAEAPEIFQYIQDVVQQFNLRDYCQFNSEVVHTEYQEKDCVWHIALKDGKQLSCQYLILASGPLYASAFSGLHILLT